MALMVYGATMSKEDKIVDIVFIIVCSAAAMYAIANLEKDFAPWFALACCYIVGQCVDELMRG